MTKAANQDWISIGLGLTGLAMLGFAVVTSDRPEPTTNLREVRQQQSQEIAQRTVDQEQSVKNSQIAIARFEAGALLVVNSEKPNEATTLTEGQPVYDMSRGVPLSDGVIVGSTDGTTAIIKNGVATDIAWTGDQSVIAEAIARSNALQRPPGQ